MHRAVSHLSATCTKAIRLNTYLPRTKVNAVFIKALSLSLLSLQAGSALSAVPGLEPQKSWDLDGYIKYMATYSIPDGTDNTFDNLIHNRLNFEYRFSSSWRVNVGLRNRALWGDSTDFPGYADLVALDSGYMDLSKNWHEGDVVINSQLDRLYLTWQQDDWGAQLGRFRINWSMNTIWNPNDIYNAYSIYDFDYEERAGTDAVILSRKLGFADGVDLVFSPAPQSGQDSASLRYFANQSGWDYQLLQAELGWITYSALVLQRMCLMRVSEENSRGLIPLIQNLKVNRPKRPRLPVLNRITALAENAVGWGAQRGYLSPNRKMHRAHWRI